MSLTGDLAETPLTDLIDFFCMRQETVAVSVVASDDGPGGVLFIEHGALVDARLGDLVGESAVREALRLKNGDYRVERDVRCQQRTIFEPWRKLVLEAARLADEANRDKGPPREARVASNGTQVKHCIVCSREYHEGTTCPLDGGALVARPPSSLPPGTAPRHLPTPQAVRTAPVSQNVVHGSVPPPPPAQAMAGHAHAHSQPPQPVHSQPPPPPAITPRIASSPPPAQQPGEGGGKGLALGLAVAAVAVIAIAAFFFLRRDSSPTPAARPAAQAGEPVRKQVNGVTDTEILFGQAAPFSGASKELGRGMKVGVELAFAAANDAGGVHGRKLKLLPLDDGYEPTRTKDVMKDLIETRKVFAILGNVGTPTSAVAVPYALDKKTLFFGAFTGAGLLRKDPPDRYVFNYRASYAEETAAVVRYLIEQRRIKPEQIAVFAQEDPYGDAGFAGVAGELRRHYKRDPATILRVGYKRNTIDVVAAVERIIEAREVRAVVMVPAYRAAARFVEKVKERRPDMVFTSVSFVGASALAEEFQQVNAKIGEGVIVTQVVPLPSSKSTVVLRYQELLGRYAPGERPDFVSLEGYLAANLLIEGLRRHGRGVDTESLVTTLENLRNVDLGIGTQLSFGLSEHQASHKVWGTVLDGTGQYQSLELD